MNLSSVHSAALSGMQSAYQRLGGAAAQVARFGTTGSEAGDGGALAGNLVAERVALYEFKANLRTFQAGDEMLGTLLDLRA